MRKSLLIALLVAAPLQALAETILVLGDSISAAYGIPLESGWVNLLEERLEKHYPGRYQVVNASVSGDTTAGGVNRLPPLLAEHEPDQVILELGGNDGLRGLPLPQMRQNLRAMVEMAREQGAEVVLVSVELPTSYGPLFQERFADVFETVAGNTGVSRVELGFDLLKSRELLQEDGIHPTAEAQPLLLEAIWPHLLGMEEGQRSAEPCGESSASNSPWSTAPGAPASAAGIPP